MGLWAERGDAGHGCLGWLWVQRVGNVWDPGCGAEALGAGAVCRLPGDLHDAGWLTAQNTVYV